MNEAEQAETDFEKRKLMRDIQNRNNNIRSLQARIHNYNIHHDVAFGIQTQKIQNNLIIVGEGFITYVVGTSICIKDVVGKSAQFLTKDGKLRNITVINAVQKKKAIIIGAGESTIKDDERYATVTVINSRKNKWYSLSLGIRASIKHISFNVEKKYCATLSTQLNTNSPIIHLWHYKKEKLLASSPLKIIVDKITIHPSKQKNILVSGPTYIKVWEAYFQEKILKETHTALLPSKIEKEHKIIDHGWLSFGTGYLLLVLAMAMSTSKMVVLIIQNDGLKKVFPLDNLQINFISSNKDDEINEDNDELLGYGFEDSVSKEKISVNSPQEAGVNPNASKLINSSAIVYTCLCPTKRGFTLGGNKGFVSFFDIDKNLSVSNTLNFQSPNGDDNKVIFVSINNNDSIGTIVTATNKDEQLNYYVLNLFQVDSGFSPMLPFYSAGFHNKKISSITTSRCKAIFATCGEDNYVRVWSYFDSDVEEKSGIISQYFKEEPLCVSLHPFGHFLAVAFGNSFKIYAVLSDALNLIATINLTLCKLVKYSNGGHYIVTNERSNVMLYDTIYYENIMSFDLHTSTIRDISIAEDDIHIVSTCESGYVFLWNLKDSNVDRNPDHRNAIYNSIIYDKGNDLLFGCTNEKHICIYHKKCKEPLVEFLSSEFDTKCAVIAPKTGLIFVGTSLGTIRILLWPMNNETLELEALNTKDNVYRYVAPEFIEQNVLSCPISKMEISPDENTLIVGGDDGTLLLYKIQANNPDIEDKKAKEDRLRFGMIANEIFLEKITKLKGKNEQIKKLQFEVTKAQQTVKIESKKLEMTFQAKIEQIIEEHKQNIEANNQKKDLFVGKALSDYERYKTELIQQIKNNTEEIDHTVRTYKEKEAFEESRNKELEEEIANLKRAQEEKLEKLLNKQKEEVAIIKNQYAEKCEKVQAKLSKIKEDAHNFGNQFIEKLEQNEKDCEKENDDKIKEIHEEIAKEKQINGNLFSTDLKLQREVEFMKGRDNDMQSELNGLIQRNNELKEANIKHSADLIKMQEQLLEREEVIIAKEETCKAAKDEQINLENFRYLLDQKIKMLSNDKQEILKTIANQEIILKETFQELIKESNKNDTTHEESRKIETKISVMQRELRKMDLEVFLIRNKIKELNTHLGKLLTRKEQKDKWGQIILDIMQRIAKNNDPEGKITGKKEFNDQEIVEILQQAEEKAFNVNDELLKQAKWVTQKLHLINTTGQKLREVKEKNIQIVLSQNGKLIEECNELRNENERLTNKMRYLERIVFEGSKKKNRHEANRLSMAESQPIRSNANKQQILDPITPLGAEMSQTDRGPEMIKNEGGTASDEGGIKLPMIGNKNLANISTDVSTLRKSSNNNFEKRSDSSVSDANQVSKKAQGGGGTAAHKIPPQSVLEEAPPEFEKTGSNFHKKPGK